LFKWASESRNAVAADLLCIETTLRTAKSQLQPGILLFLDVMVETSESNHFGDVLRKFSDWLKPWNVILTLRGIPLDFRGLGRNSAPLTQSGIRTCLEYTSVMSGTESTLVAGRPHFIKMPAEVICRPEQTGAENVMEAFLGMVSSLGATIIATGVVETRQVETCRKLGIHFIEGPIVAKLKPGLRSAPFGDGAVA